MRSSWKVALAGALVAIGCGDNVAPPARSGSTDDGGSGTADSGTAADGSGSTPDASCTPAEVFPEPMPTYLEFVADGSGSMTGVKWDAQVSALQTVIRDIGTRTGLRTQVGKPADVVAGLMIFGDTGDISASRRGPYPTSADVPLQAVTNASELAFARRLQSATSDSSPTKAALTGGYAALANYAPPANVRANGQRILVLVSDSPPIDGTPSEVVNLAKDSLAATLPIWTAPVGLGAGGMYDYGTFMSELAYAGGITELNCGDESASVQCVHQLNTLGKTAPEVASIIVAMLRSTVLPSDCELVLPALVDAKGPVPESRMEVTLVAGNGKETVIPRDAFQGWGLPTFKRGKRLALTGTSCDQLRADARARVRVRSRCG
ncbi:MAG: VWA domain-containing protein [Polyangiaceae bacterium]|nr:VWA domain-containing protein [Polyangiaceae bacterium]